MIQVLFVKYLFRTDAHGGNVYGKDKDKFNWGWGHWRGDKGGGTRGHIKTDTAMTR